MQQPQSYYQKNVQKYQVQLQQLKQKSLWISISRFVVFIVAVLVLYFNFNVQTLLGVAIIFIPFFLILLSKSTDVKNAIATTQAFLKLNQDELKILSGDFSMNDNGKAFANPEHFYAYDIDLFGDYSFFQNINRSTKISSKIALAGLLLANDNQNIPLKQEAVKELASKPDWRQKLLVVSNRDQSKIAPSKIIAWFQSYQPKSAKWMLYVPILFGIISIILSVAFYLGQIDAKIFGAWFVLGLGIIRKNQKNIYKLYTDLDAIMPSLISLKNTMLLVENEKFKSSLLQGLVPAEVSAEKSISHKLDALIKIYKRKELTNSIIIKLLADAYFLFDILSFYQFENWIERHKNEIKEWYNSVDTMEAYSQFGNYAFNHPDFVYPEIVQDHRMMLATQFGHPLIDKSKRVNNDFSIHSDEFFIITGANMAGKSTFLRTVSLGIVMANVGLPVCAEKFVYQPVKLITSMRTNDSLSKEESYFFSELKRLRFIIDQISTDTYFIALDEILKGTNSKDKAEGSKKFVEKLMHTGTTGIIATHDLSLCTLEDTYDSIHNYFFDAEIINDELYFDYKLKTGICQNMNASFLLKKMQIID